MTGNTPISYWLEIQMKEGKDLESLHSEDEYWRFVKETGADVKYRSYQRAIQRLRRKLGSPSRGQEKPSTEIVDVEVPKTLDINVLKQVLVDYTQEKGKKLNNNDLKEIAEEIDVPVSAIIGLEGLKDFLENAYQIAKLDIDQDKTVNRLKGELSDLRKKYNNLLSSQVTYEDWIESLRETYIGQVDPIEPYPEVIIPQHVSDKLYYHAVLSDWHYGAVVDPADVMNINRYNEDIAEARMNEYFHKLVQHAQRQGVTRLHLSLLGDMIEGMIQPDSEQSQNIEQFEQMFRAARIITQNLQEISHYFEEIEIVTKPGNHGRDRPGKPSVHDEPHKNYDNGVYKLIEKDAGDVIDRMRIEPVHIGLQTPFDTGITYIDHHGHKFGKGGNGYNPTSNAIGKNGSMMDRLVEEMKDGPQSMDYIIIGHFHNMTELKTFNYKTVYVNGSIVGATPFSVNVLHKADPPEQFVLLVHEDEGGGSKAHLYLSDFFPISESAGAA